MQVNENRLDTILQNFVESFNDCACCPLTFDCEKDNEGIDCYECAELLKKWLTILRFCSELKREVSSEKVTKRIWFWLI